MTGRITKSYIDALNEQFDDVLRVAGVRINTGKDQHLVRCFSAGHDDQKPSMSVNTAAHSYHCHGCGCGGGGAISAFAEHTGMDAKNDFIAVVEKMSDALGMTIEYEDSPNAKVSSDIQEALHQVAQHALKPPYFDDDKRDVATYFDARNITKVMRDAGRIGFLANNFASSPVAKKYQSQLLETGILKEKDDKSIYSPFAGRIIFPIADHRGKMIALAGRVFRESDTRAKYRNSDETVVFKKNQVLYGMHEIAGAAEKPGYVVVTEGYLDQLRASTSGIPAVGTMGTALTKSHLRLLSRHTKKIVFAMDPDPAGKRAAERAMLSALSFLGKMDVTFAELSNEDGEKLDPDAYIRRYGKAEFKKLIDNATSVIDMAARYIAPDHQDTLLALLNGGMAERANEVFDALPDGAARPLVAAQLASNIAQRLDLNIVPEHLGIALDQSERIKELEHQLEDNVQALAVAEARLKEATTSKTAEKTIPDQRAKQKPEKEPVSSSVVNEPEVSTAEELSTTGATSKQATPGKETMPAIEGVNRKNTKSAKIPFRLKHYHRGTPGEGDWFALDDGNALRFVGAKDGMVQSKATDGTIKELAESTVAQGVRLNVQTTTASKFDGKSHKKGDTLLKLGDKWLNQLPQEHISVAKELLTRHPMAITKDTDLAARVAKLAYPDMTADELETIKATDLKRTIGSARDLRQVPKGAFLDRPAEPGDAVASIETDGVIRKVARVEDGTLILEPTKKQQCDQINASAAKVVSIKTEMPSKYSNRFVVEGEPVYAVMGVEGITSSLPISWMVSQNQSKPVRTHENTNDYTPAP